MNQRERLLVIGLGSILGAWLLWGFVRTRLIEPLQSRDAQIVALQGDVEKKKKDLMVAQHAATELSQWRQVALPADESVAQTLYLDELRKMLTSAGMDRPALRPGRSIKRGDIFSRIPVNIDCRCSLAELTTFLRSFENSPYLHQVRRLRLQPVLKDDMIVDFDVSLAIEAVSMVDSFSKDSLPKLDNAKLAYGERPDRSDKEFSIFAKKNPFQPTEVVKANKEPEKTDSSKSTADETQDNYITATLFVDGKWEIWLTNRSNQSRKVIREGEKFEVGGMSGEIVRIEGNAVVLKVGEKTGTVRIGNNLASWKASEDAKPAEPTTSASNEKEEIPKS